MSDEREIWVGLVDAVPIDPAGAEVGGAFVHVVAPAGSWLELHAAADAALLPHGLRVGDLDEAEPVRDQLQSEEGVAPELLELALDAAHDREVRLGEFHAYPPDGHPDPEAFAAEGAEEIAADLRELAASRTLVCLRGGREHDTVGYVAGVGARWALAQIVNANGLPDGWRALTLQAIGEIEPIDPEISYLPRLVATRPVTAMAPDVDLDNARALMEAAARHSDVLYLEADDMPPGAFWVGRVAKLDHEGAVLRKISSAGLWDGEVRCSYESITRVGFGGRYEEALALAAGPDPET